jgi:hypothetical protein
MHIGLLMISACLLLFVSDPEVLQMMGKFDFMNIVANRPFVKCKLEVGISSRVEVN